MLGELDPSGERTVTLGCRFVFLAACRARDRTGKKTGCALVRNK